MKILKSRIIRESVFYGFSTALNKGLVLIALPLLIGILSLEEYGIWALIEVIVSLGAPLVSLNAASSIMREGIGNTTKGNIIFSNYLKLIVPIAVLIIIVSTIMPTGWLSYTLLLIAKEAFMISILAWYRSQNKHFLYLLTTLTKIIALFIAAFITKTTPSLFLLLKYQIIIGSLLLVPFYLVAINTIRNSPKLSDFKSLLIFSLSLIPHGLSQWVLNASDRTIIKSILGNTDLGIYTLAYTLSMVFLLINSGLALTLPNHIIKNYNYWLNSSVRIKFLIIYSIVFTLISFTIVLVSYVFKPYFNFLDAIDNEVLILMKWILIGLYLLGVYLFYVNYLFYLKKSVVISAITMSSAIINIILTIIFVKFYGIIGAAISTFLSYFIYSALCIIFANKYEKLLRANVLNEIILILVSLSINFIFLDYLINHLKNIAI